MFKRGGLYHVVVMNFLLSTLFAVTPMMNPGVDFSMNPDVPDHVEINNRILLKIGGKPLSVMDVVRKMDLVFYQEYPQLISQPVARYQYYSANWRAMLRNVIDDHLIMLDAEEKKVEVSEGEIREELEKLFGPNVVFSIDKLGLSYEEAWELIRTELTVSRMTSMMVHSKTLADIHPIEVKKRYEKMLADNPPEDRWVYQVISFRAPEESRSLVVAEKAYNLLAQQRVSLDLVEGQIQEDGVQFSLSAEYERTPKEISNSHRSILEKLENGAFSQPMAKRGVAYIFYLKEYRKGEPVPFHEAATKIKQEIIGEKLRTYTQDYRGKLRKRYGMTDDYITQIIPETTQPFALL